MKKFLFLLVTALVSATMSFAQSTLVATLSHGEDITMFYGSGALQAAYEEAVSGDLINLSGGTFQAVDITKAITLRGTGIDDDSPTCIAGEITINIPENDTELLSMEGIRCIGDRLVVTERLNNAFFYKCFFDAFCLGNLEWEPKVGDFVMANCKCKFTCVYCLGFKRVSFLNSYLGDFDSWNYRVDKGGSLYSVSNCILTAWGQFEGTQLSNCIILAHKINY